MGLDKVSEMPPCTKWLLRPSYERGTSEPEFATASKLAKELGVPLAYLLADNDVLADVILAVAAMSPAEQRKTAAELKAKAKR